MVLKRNIPQKLNARQQALRDKQGCKKPPVLSTYVAVNGQRTKTALSRSYPSNQAIGRHFQMAKKLLHRANGRGLSEGELFAQKNIITKLCETHNIDIDDVIQAVNMDQDPYKCGCSSVHIRRYKKDDERMILKQTWMLDLGDAYSSNFDCYWFTQKSCGRLTAKFYGAAQSTLLAATAFRLAYNQVTTMGQVYKGGIPRNSYLLGVAQRILDRAKQRQQAFDNAIEAAKALYHEGEDDKLMVDDDEFEPFTADFDFDAVHYEDEESGYIKLLDGVKKGTGEQQLQWFEQREEHQANKQNAAIQWLERNNIRPRAEPTRTKRIGDIECFIQGYKDGDLVDLGQLKLAHHSSRLGQAEQSVEDEEDSDDSDDSDCERKRKRNGRGKGKSKSKGRARGKGKRYGYH